MRRALALILISFFCLSVLQGCGIQKEAAKKDEKKESKKIKVKEATKEVKEPVIVKDGDKALELINYGEHQPADKSKKPADGFVFYQVTLNVTNELKTFSDVAAFDYWLIDPSGNEYEPIEKMEGWPEDGMVDLAPGELKRVTFQFEIPAGLNRLRLTNDTEMIIELK